MRLFGEEYDYYTGQEADNMTASDSTVLRDYNPGLWARLKALKKYKRENGICEAGGCHEALVTPLGYCQKCHDFFTRRTRKLI
jgi:hypothetical protein